MENDGQDVCIVTGGSRGIGRAIIDRLRGGRYVVVSCGRGVGPEDLATDIVWVQGDISKPADAKKIVNMASAHGSVQALVNNAGIQLEKTLPDTTDSDWDLLIGVNCRGVFNMCRAVLPLMSKKGGNIINLGSISANMADPLMALYNASKGFIHALTRSLAVDHGPHIRCNAISPGWILTDMAQNAFALARDPARARADALRRHPARRFGTPADVAKAVAWLLDDESDFITGHCLTLDGGLTAASPLQPGLF